MIGVQVFGKEETFDPRTDPIVRVQARRLRAKLVRYYREEGRADETVIELPKGGYAPVFKQRDTPVLIKRSVAAALVSRNTVAVLPFADHSVGARPRVLLPRRPRRDRPPSGALRRRCASWRPTSRASPATRPTPR